ncbi:MAG: SAM-dependent methyltransferase, partial [Thermoproteota archaeon]
KYDSNEELVKVTFSSPRSKAEELKSVIIQRTTKPEEIKVEYRFNKHNDIKSVLVLDIIENDLLIFFSNFKQCHIKTNKQNTQILLNKNLSSKIIIKENKEEKRSTHNRDKNYLIPDGEQCLFLIEIGVMDKDGKVKPNYYKKFRQINRFLELVHDLYKNDEKDFFHIVDFGCGKSYLTFALYHYFTVIKKAKVKITGIDLKQEVIDHCNSIAEKVFFTELKFVHGFIHDFITDDPIDFVVTLHACDTATDDAILFSLRRNAKKMMFVPCCQHELNKQLENSEAQIMLKHGIFRDRMTALVTDTMRTQLLEACGFKVQSMEFIDLEHTAKNILLRCVEMNKTDEQKNSALLKYQEFKQQWQINPYLETQLSKEGFI